MLIPWTTSLILLVLLQNVGCRRLVVHDTSFVPDYVLNVTYEPLSAACRTNLAVLVNGEELSHVCESLQILT